MLTTKLLATGLTDELTLEHQSLVGGEPAHQAANQDEIVSQQGQALYVSASIRHFDAAVPPPQRQRRGDSSLDRAASTQGTATVLDTRDETLLERVGDVRPTGKRAVASGALEQLERRLAVAILQILPGEPVSMGRQQQLAARTNDERDRLARVRGRQAAIAADSFERLLSGRHVSMSVRVASTPPSQFLRARLEALDAFQQRSSRLGFVVAVFKRFDDDQASQMGALIAYYGFFSLFPLLLVFVTVLGFILEGSPSTQESVVHSTLSQFPVIGTQLQQNVHSLTGSVPALVIGLLGATLAGLGITGAAQSAFNKVWEIPRSHQLGFLAWRLRGVGMLVVFGLLTIVSTLAAGYVTAQTTGTLALLGGIVVALAANLLLFFAVFRLLTAEEVPTRDLLPGVIVAAVLWQILQHVGGFYVEHVVRHAKETSGLFAFVLGLLTWLYLGGQVTVIAAEVNVVRARRLWPRALFSKN
jgi:membrane protein